MEVSSNTEKFKDGFNAVSVMGAGRKFPLGVFAAGPPLSEGLPTDILSALDDAGLEVVNRGSLLALIERIDRQQVEISALEYRIKTLMES